MEGYYKLYTWLNHTILMLFLQIVWKINQLSDFFKERPKDETTMIHITPVTSDLKFKRHIRSMSDVQSSTPYKFHSYKLRRGSLYSLSYDTESKRYHRYPRINSSSDSSDIYETHKKSLIILEDKIMKHSDSMRVL